ncbi:MULTISPECIES: FAD:protein FMN transferase [Micromonospora]|uniref:FAD:protein FMN transferase n=1 Tax=Micromonospora TaxID=1873 RepID=UPI0031D7003B
MRIDEQPRQRWVDQQPRTRWVDQSAFASRRPDLRLGTRSHRLDAAGGTAVDRIAVQHTVRTGTAEYSLLLNAPSWLGRRGVGEALADAVAELRAVDLTYGPTRPDSLVSRLRRGEISPESYAPLADLVDRCAAMRAATDGWFDAWAVPGGFDPGGLLGGWAVERAAARLRAAGIHDYAVLTGADLVVRGHAPHGGPWRVAVHHPTDPRRAPLALEMTAGAVGTSGVTGRRGHVVDPHTGEPADQLDAATVIGPDLAVADAYATALYAAGPAGLVWFRNGSDYRALFAHRRR